MFEGLKGPGASQALDGSNLRVLIVHARWNSSLIKPLVEGAKIRLLASGVKESRIVIQNVPGSWELPIAVQRLYAASQIQAALTGASSGDLLGASTTDLTKITAASDNSGPFDSIIAIGVLIKGDTVHFEHIAESVCRGLMRVQLDFGVPVIFGLLTVLNEEQAKRRAGLTPDGHNHGEDWGDAAVEMGLKRKLWSEGVIQ
ncbi:6,7-dimethyl-8-ribityllumazine synthase [Tirmania nivea]|nr:6,7-dimethyl-8-ribityllumazine synthase [Tirmania nivea]